MNWTKPFHGVQHFGKAGNDKWWLTVVDYGSFAELSRWYPGCALHPHESNHPSAAEARTAGERWLASLTPSA